MRVYVQTLSQALFPVQDSSENKNIKVHKTTVTYSCEGKKRKFPIATYGTLDIAIRCAEAADFSTHIACRFSH